MKILHAIILSLTLAVSGCAHVQVTTMNPPSRAMSPKAPDQVKVYLTKPPEAAYEEVYLLRSDAADSEAALEAMRQKSGALGCDGLIIAGSADRVVSSSGPVSGTTVSSREGFVGSCILFL